MIPNGIFISQNTLTPEVYHGKSTNAQNGSDESHLNEEEMKLLGLLWKRMYLVYDAAHEGKLGQIRADLPDYYISVDKVWGLSKN